MTHADGPDLGQPRQLPVVHEGAAVANEAAERAARSDEQDRWQAEQAQLCSVFTATGKHDLVPDQRPTFMCGEEPWMGYVRHCTGTRTWVTRSGQFTYPCVVFEIPGERRGSHGRKRLLRAGPDER